MVGLERFELSTFRPPDERANQAALQPENNAESSWIFHTWVEP